MKIYRLFAAAIATMLLATSCGQKTAPADKPFIVGRAADSLALDPAAADDDESTKVLGNICEGLVRFKSGKIQVEPCLAETWNLSSDSQTCIIALREGVKFHDGTPLDAAAIAWNFGRQVDTNAPGTAPSATLARRSVLFSNIEAVRVLDAQRLELRLKKPNPALLANLATASASLISPRAPANHGKTLSRHPVGTGPFKLREWQPNESIVLEANPDYWGPKPRSERVVFKVITNSSARLTQLRTGQIHAMDGLNPNDLASVRADRHLTLLESPGINMASLAFNCLKPPMDRLEFRQAVAAAVQRSPIIESVYRGAAVAATSVLPPALRPADTKIEEWPLDIERARGLIAQLQIVVKPITISTNDTFGLPITITTNITERVELPLLKLHVMTQPCPCLPNPAQAAESIKSDLEAIGLKVQIVAQDPAAYLASVSKGEHDLALHVRTGLNADPDYFLRIIDPATSHVGDPTNISFLEDYQLAAALSEAREQLDAEKRAAAYLRAMAIVREHLPIIPLVYANDLIVLRREVRDFVLQPSLEMRLAPVFLR